MNAERWLQITKSFTENQKSSEDDEVDKEKNEEKGNQLVTSSPVRRNVQRLNSTPTLKPSTVQPQLLIQNNNADNLKKENDRDRNGVSPLKSLLHKQSEFIQEQERIIKQLEADVGIARLMQHDTANENSNPKKMKPACESSLVKRSGPTLLRRNTMKIQRATSPSEMLAAILERLESLEFRMSKLVATLPQRISKLCEEYMSTHQFMWVEREGGQCLLTPQAKVSSSLPTTDLSKPIWLRSPVIKPRLCNNKSSAVAGTVKQKQEDQDKKRQEDYNNNDFQLRLIKLEKTISELKISFIHLLMDKVRRGCQCQYIEEHQGECGCVHKHGGQDVSKLVETLLRSCNIR